MLSDPRVEGFLAKPGPRRCARYACLVAVVFLGACGLREGHAEQIATAPLAGRYIRLPGATASVPPATIMQGVAVDTLGALTLAAFLGALTSWRARLASARVRERDEARVSERDRIARDLHDTLLPGIEGLILKLHAAAEQLPPGNPTRAYLSRSLDQAEALLIEGRRKLLGLREPWRSRLELSRALATLGIEWSAGTSTTFDAVKAGRVRVLQAVAWDEIFGIAREALTNAFKHASACHIEAMVIYGESSLTVKVYDDGGGMPQGRPPAAAGPRFGIRGMQERARNIRAQLQIGSAPGGTAVTLTVPARVAYCRATPELEPRD